jgi:hypothetical protein
LEKHLLFKNISAFFVENLNNMEKSIQESVAEQILTLGNEVKKTVINKLAQVEITKRVDIITKGVLKLETLEKELKKINRNDIVNYIDGKPIDSMSKTRFDEIAKAKGKIERLNNAMDNALVQNSFESYEKLADVLKSLDGGGNKTESAGDSQ